MERGGRGSSLHVCDQESQTSPLTYSVGYPVYPSHPSPYDLYPPYHNNPAHTIPPSQQQHVPYPPHASSPSPPPHYNHQVNIPPHLRNLPTKEEPQRMFARNLLCIALTFVIIIGMITSMVRLQLISPTLPEFRIIAFNMTKFEFSKTSTSMLNATWDFTINITNNNQGMSAKMQMFMVYMTHGDHFVADQPLSSFDVREKSYRLVEVHVSTVDRWQLIEPLTVDAMDYERNMTGGTMRFKVVMQMVVVFWQNVFYSVRMPVGVTCDNMVVLFANDLTRLGTLIQEPDMCTVVSMY